MDQHDHLRPNRPPGLAAAISGTTTAQQQLDQSIGQPLFGATGIGAALSPAIGPVETIGFTLKHGTKLCAAYGVDLAVDHGHTEAIVEDSQTPGLSATLLFIVGVAGILVFADPVSNFAGEQIGRSAGGTAEQ